jgi:hypothetical protein
MSTITIPRPNVTVEEVSAVLRNKLGAHYEVTPAVTAHFHHESPGRADSILVKRHWFEQASIRVVPGANGTEIRVGSAANFTPTGYLINRARIVRKVRQALKHAPELAGS